MTNQARARVLAERPAAAVAEIPGVRVDSLSPEAGVAHAGRARTKPPATPRGSRVTGRAVALNVTARAGVDVSLCFPGVVRGGTWRVRPQVGRRVKATAPREVGVGTAHGDARPLVAADAERLLAVTARTARAVLTGRHGVHADPVVGMDLARPNPTVMTVSAEARLVTGCAQLTVVARHLLVPLDPVGSMR